MLSLDILVFIFGAQEIHPAFLPGTKGSYWHEKGLAVTLEFLTIIAEALFSVRTANCYVALYYFLPRSLDYCSLPQSFLILSNTYMPFR